MRWFVLFVRTGSETNAMEFLKESLNSAMYTPFVLKKESLYRSGRRIELYKKLLFPGYIIVETSKGAEDVLSDMRCIVDSPDSNIYRVLNYGDEGNDIFMREVERLRWVALIDTDYCIVASTCIIQQGKIVVTAGALLGKESWIIKINRNKNLAMVDVEFDGKSHSIPLALRITE